MNDNSSGGCGFLIGVLFALGLLSFGAVSCVNMVKKESKRLRMTSGGGVAASVYDKHQADHPNWHGSTKPTKNFKPVDSLPASSTSKNRRCTDNPYSQSAANTYGVPLALIQCVHFAETSCGTGGRIKGKYQAWGAVKKLNKPTKHRHALHIIADDLGMHVSEMRSNRGGAMGPFQFLPTGWVASGVDADGDSDVNPYSLADATYGGANHLAKAKAKTGSWRGAIAKRNSKKSYVSKVASCAGL